MAYPAQLTRDSSSLSPPPENPEAYHQLTTRVEAKLRGYEAKAESDDDTSLILQAFMDHLPYDGKHLIGRDFLQCSTDEEVKQLVQNLKTALIMPLMSKACHHEYSQLTSLVKARSKTPSAVLSPYSAIDDIDEIGSELESAFRREQGRLKAACLARDGLRCVITGALDLNEALNMYPPDQSLPSRVAATEAAHILPFSLGSFTERKVISFDLLLIW